MRYVEHVELTLEEWDEVLRDRAELARLRTWAAEQAEHDREYLNWSLTDALALRRAIEDMANDWDRSS